MTNRFKRALSVLLWLLSLAVVARAQPDDEQAESLDDPKTEAEAFDIAQRTMSPFCPGRTLADCPSDRAAAWRQDIRRMLQQGKSPAEIRRVLNERSGLNLTGAPESSIGWALPAGLLVGAVGILALVVVRFRKDDESETTPPRAANDDDDDDDEREDASQGDGRRNRERDEDEDEDEDDEGEDGSSEEAELEARLRRELEDED